MKKILQKIPFIFSILFLFVSVFVFVFIYQKINDNNLNAEKANTEWQTEAMRREEIKSLDRALSMVAEESRVLDTHFAFSSDVVPFLNTIEKLALSVGAEPEITSVSTSEADSVLSADFRADGSFESLYKFISLLEQSPYMIEISAFELSRPLKAGELDINNKNPKWEVYFHIKLLSFLK